MRRRGAVVLAGVLVFSLPSSPAGAKRVNCGPPSTRAHRLAPLPRGLGEASGLVASWKHHGAGWFIRDSGRPASIYSFRLRNGRPVVREVKVLGAENTDWEDITYAPGPDGRGRLLIVESMQSRRDPYIYEIIEPDPDRARTVRLHRRIRYKYPGVGYQNTEASFWYRSQLVLATKSNPTRLYRFRSLDGEGTLRPEYVGVLKGAPRISVLRPALDRSALVAADHETVYVFRGNGKGTESYLEDFVGKWPAYSKRIFPGDNVEAGDYFPAGSCHVVLLSERRSVYRVPTL